MVGHVPWHLALEALILEAGLLRVLCEEAWEVVGAVSEVVLEVAGMLMHFWALAMLDHVRKCQPQEVHSWCHVHRAMSALATHGMPDAGNQNWDRHPSQTWSGGAGGDAGGGGGVGER